MINKQLYSTIDSTKSSYNIQKNKIEIILYKLLHQNWPTIEGNAEAFIELPAHSAPSSSSKVYATELPKPYATKKDWNSITSRYVYVQVVLVYLYIYSMLMFTTHLTSSYRHIVELVCLYIYLYKHACHNYGLDNFYITFMCYI